MQLFLEILKMSTNYYKIHPNKKRRKFVGFGKYMSAATKQKTKKYLLDNFPVELRKDVFFFIGTPLGMKKEKVS